MFFQHNRRTEAKIRSKADFFARCMERPSDPGKMHKIPHVLQLACPAYASIPITLFAYDLTLSKAMCFLQNLRFRYNAQLRLTEADRYLFLELLFEHIQGPFQEIYGRERTFITSKLPHFTEIAAAAGFRVTRRSKQDEGEGWRALIWA